MKIPVSFLMLTYNEEINLRVSLPLLTDWADDIVIVDSFSTDKTLEIAGRFGAHVYPHAFESHASQWLWAMQKIEFKYHWIFMHDPDHAVTPELKQELDQVFASEVDESVDGFYVKRRNIFRGQWIKHGGYYPKYMLKIVRRGKVFFDKNEFDYRAYVPGKKLKLKHDIIEDNLKEHDISFWIEKHNRFAARQAEEEILRMNGHAAWSVKPAFFGTPDQRTLRLKVVWYKMPLYLRPFIYFFYRYLLCLGFLDGKQGFIFHFLQGFWYRLLVDIKLDDLKKGGFRFHQSRSKS